MIGRGGKGGGSVSIGGLKGTQGMLSDRTDLCCVFGDPMVGLEDFLMGRAW